MQFVAATCEGTTLLSTNGIVYPAVAFHSIEGVCLAVLPIWEPPSSAGRRLKRVVGAARNIMLGEATFYRVAVSVRESILHCYIQAAPKE